MIPTVPHHGITPELIEQAKAELALTQKYVACSIENDLSILLCEMGLNRQDLMKKSRKRSISHQRWPVFAALRRMGYTYEDIGDAFNVGHTTILHGIQKLEQLKAEAQGVES
ncbi:MAG: helix-turn-helix domain-containing protein [Verrucomicrobiota bacterium]